MNLNLRELEIIERLLENRLNICCSQEIEELLHKFKREINDKAHQFNGTMGWAGREYEA